MGCIYVVMYLEFLFYHWQPNVKWCHDFTDIWQIKACLTLQLSQSSVNLSKATLQKSSVHTGLCCSYQHTSKFTKGTTLYMVLLN